METLTWVWMQGAEAEISAKAKRASVEMVRIWRVGAVEMIPELKGRERQEEKGGGRTTFPEQVAETAEVNWLNWAGLRPRVEAWVWF